MISYHIIGKGSFMNTEYNAHDESLTPEGQPLLPPLPPLSQQQPKRKSSFWRILSRIILVLSVLANIGMFLVIVGMGAYFATAGGTDSIMEKVIVAGPAEKKIAVIKLQGIINKETAERVSKQIKAVRMDYNVKAVIIRTFSPGGSVFASDRLHHEIMTLRQDTEIPVIAFMEGLAASGAYYTSVACDQIIAEPTTITGSIGVMMGHFVLQELLEEKLGIQPVVIKSGPRKDWPSSFTEVTDEQKAYLRQKIIAPAYERFVQLVADGRDGLTLAQARDLADGSIYHANEALENKMIDEIGYIEEAIDLAKLLADIDDARVVEYEEQFSFASLLHAEAKTILPKLDRTTLRELSTPELMCLWDAGL